MLPRGFWKATARLLWYNWGERAIPPHIYGHKNNKLVHSNHPKYKNSIVRMANTHSATSGYTGPCRTTGERVTRLHCIHRWIQSRGYWHHNTGTVKKSILGLEIKMANGHSASPTHRVNPTRMLKINDLNLAGMVLGCMVLEHVWPELIFKHACFFLRQHIRGSMGLHGEHV